MDIINYFQVTIEKTSVSKCDNSR